MEVEFSLGILTILHPILPILILIANAVIIIFLSRITRSKAVLGGLSTLFMGGSLYFSIINLLEVLQNGTPLVLYYSTFGPPIGSCFEIDGLSAFLGIIFVLIGFAVSIYSVGYMEKEGIHNYYVLLTMMVTGLLGVVYAGDLFTLFVFYELLGVSAYILVAFYKNEEAIEASFKYLVMGAMGSALVLYGMALTYGLAGSLNMALIADTIGKAPMSAEMYLIIVLFIIGFGVKAAIVPMHSWLPDAHPAAPSGISAMLSGVVIKAGMYALFRTLFIMLYGKSLPNTNIWGFNISLLFAIIAIFTVTIPNIIALSQTDIKRMLAYSSIYNMGIIFAGLAIGTKFAIAAAIFHVLNHATAKALLFMNSGAFIMRTETRKIDELTGIGKRMPATGISFLLGCLSLAGLPPLAGFYSKFLVIWAAVLAIFDGNVIGYLIAIILAINATISLGYYFAILVRKIVTATEPTETVAKAVEAPKSVILAQFLLVAIILWVSFLPLVVMDVIASVIDSLFDIETYISVALP